ncbi:class F sortase [Demequina sp. NBRC 110057]|uniref:class F sortase n=1 Tax=Demequina sp. NBRC 110057 TaxID=1570346 RepID=UPI0009FC7A8F|nr:class F sortase [Demequina sp. NBRC 110057]
MRRPVLVAVIGSVLAGILAGCAGMEPETRPSATPTAPSVTSAPSVGEVTAPRVMGSVEVRSASPAEMDVAQVDGPVRLEVAGVDIDMPVVPVGVDDRGGMTIPEGALSAGWYRFGPAPGGSAGNAVLAAHVDNADGLGPFARLREVVPGERVEVTTEGGAEILYEVASVEQTGKSDVDLSAVFDPDGPPALILVTCGGDWQESIGHYADNVIVTATPLDDVP